MNCPNVEFLMGQRPDQSGRFVREYLEWPGEKWEECHDHMQWAFPTQTRSAFNLNATTLPDDFNFDGSPQVTSTLVHLFTAYMASLGVDVTHDELLGYELDWKPTWKPEHDYWMDGRNHNSLRMTRILECFNLFNMTELRDALYDFLVYVVMLDYSHRYTMSTLVFWTAAKDNKLSLLR